ncbi:hypothetical protein NicSoilB11_31530 [Arthrobacter sp. NicSoilB11]|nr:hypothetical protein NicSoilB11_31530 [Arthrobacter sp. NicSoilB11]
MIFGPSVDTVNKPVRKEGIGDCMSLAEKLRVPKEVRFRLSLFDYRDKAPSCSHWNSRLSYNYVARRKMLE